MTESEHKDENHEIVRQPLQTPYMRRDSEHNPEFLDPERALARFAPLIDSIVRQLKTWRSNNGSVCDPEDLRSLAQLEFLHLHSRYDPAYGVDFPGYIKFNLRRRVIYAIDRMQRRTGREMLAFSPDGHRNVLELTADNNAEDEMDRVEWVASVPFDAIEDADCRRIVSEVLVEGKDISAMARERGITVRSMAAKIDAAGRAVRFFVQQRSGKEQPEEDAEEEPDEQRKEEDPD